MTVIAIAKGLGVVLHVNTFTTNISNEKNSLIQVVQEEIPNKEVASSDNLCSTTAYDFYNQPRQRSSDLSFEHNRSTHHIVNFDNVLAFQTPDTNDNLTTPQDNGSRPSKNIYYRTRRTSQNSSSTAPTHQNFFTLIKPTKENCIIISIPLVIFLIGISIAIVVLLFIMSQEEKRYKDSFDYLCLQRIDAIVANFTAGLNIGKDFVGFFTVIAGIVPNIIDDASGDGTVNTFGNLSAFTEMDIRTINFSPKILDVERSQYEDKHGQIKEWDDKNARQIQRVKTMEYFPIRYSIPWRLDTPTLLNYDLSSEYERKAAIMKARQTRNLAITPRIPLVYDKQKEGIVVFFPFYNNFLTGAKQQVIQSANVDVNGFIVGAYELDHTINAITKEFDGSTNIGFDIVDLESGTYIYTKDNNINWQSSDFSKQENRSIGDRIWSFTCRTSMDEYNRSISRYSPAVFFVLIAVFFIFVAALSVKYSRKHFKTRDRFTEQAARLGRTQSLLKSITADSKAVLEAIADPLVALNSKGEIVGANQHALRVTGYSPEEIKVANKMHINQLLLPAVETPMEERNLSTFNPLSESDLIIDVPVRPGMRDVLAKKKDGTVFEAEANFSQPIVEKNYFTQVVMFRDVSFKKENERLVMEAKKDADLANQSKTEFLFFLCHEIRNPTHAILGFAEMLRNSLKEKEQFEELESIMSAGKFLSFIVNDILDLTHFTNPDPYEIDLKCDEFSLHTLVDSIAKIQSIEADHKNIQIKTKTDGGLLQKVYGDERRLEQILMKLLSRSIEVAPNDGIVELIVEQKKVHRSKGVLLRFSVRDQSNGLSSDEEIQELFKPYSKTNSSIGSRFHAQGLSMALAQAIVKVMGGRLVVEKVKKNSNIGGGGKHEDANASNHVWFEIWLLTKEAKEKGHVFRESFDSTVLSKAGSAGRNSFKITSAPGSTDGKLMDDAIIVSPDFVEHGVTPEFKAQAQLRSTKSMSLSKPHRLSRTFKSTIRKKRRSTLTSSAAAAATMSGEEESNEEVEVSNTGVIKNAKVATNVATNFLRKGSIMLSNGLARASTISHSNNYEKSLSSPLAANFSQNSVNDVIIHKNEDKNIASSVQIESREITTLPPIISYYSCGNATAPPVLQEFNNLISESVRSSSIKSKNSSNFSLNTSTSMSNIRNMPMSSNSATASVGVSSTSTNLQQKHPHHIAIQNNNPSFTLSSSYAARPPSLNLTAEYEGEPSTSIDVAADIQVFTTATASSEPQRQLKILLVEDNLVCQRVTYKMLTRNNYLVDIANHGKEAVDMVENQNQQQYACILMDIITPVMNGYEATQVLRERGVNIPILALTANSFESDLKKAIDVGMNDFLTKPIKEAELIDAIRLHIEKYEKHRLLQNQQDDSMEISVESDQYLTVNS
ncbi:11290_t:CDS:2 [Funneliformis geosporum]|uniref:5070_t:CDS:1 n=1 Tax=Funneliformis geosporum TaxID=1117311 RepID=A0A9W4SX32_9GLOM|nr:11290_t:CDS:2 [Funneliformis geosporum]CAI2184531.1 5070_t:CDS:2 [Funneliformis geosporum]